MIGKKIKLVNVVQVMLLRRILPCQRWVCNLWEFNPAVHRTLRELFDMMHEDVWKVLFKANEVPPSTTEDRGLSVRCQANPVSFHIRKICLLLAHPREEPKTPCQYFRPG